MADDKPDLRAWIRKALRAHFGQCLKCKRPVAGEYLDEWGVRAFLNYPVWVVCPDCQSPEERAEAAIRRATSTYTLEGGRIVQHPVPMDDDEDDQDDHGQNHPHSA